MNNELQKIIDEPECGLEYYYNEKLSKVCHCCNDKIYKLNETQPL
jgi:hypothetical protein